jgi:hypothetical protein
MKKQFEEINHVLVRNQNGSCFIVSFERLTTWVEYEYGADADGNRGEKRYRYEEDEHQNVDVLVGEDYEPLIAQSEKIQNLVNNAIDDWRFSKDPVMEETV